MLHIIVENQYKQKLDFSKIHDYGVKVTGLTPGAATINTSKIITKDGTKFNSSTLNERNIVMTIYPLSEIEKNRINLYKYFQLKKYIKLYFKNDHRDVWIEGYVETIEGDLYESPQQLQISIICPDPYFKSIETISCDFSSVIPLFEFPFEVTSDGTAISEIETFVQKNIINPSDEETGVIVEIYANDLALEPTIHNVTTGESFTIEHEFQAGDIVRLNTMTGEKSLTLIRDGIESNILNQMETGSTWFKLRVGDNVFSYTAIHGPENLQVIMKLQPIFVGV